MNHTPVEVIPDTEPFIATQEVPGQTDVSSPALTVASGSTVTMVVVVSTFELSSVTTKVTVNEPELE